MSIKDNLYDLVIHIQALMRNKPYDFKAESKIVNMCTQQIISEIVGELEKIRQIYSGDTNAITLCIETIKKMGEV